MDVYIARSTTTRIAARKNTSKDKLQAYELHKNNFHQTTKENI
jgi:hypothetical protein